MNQSFSINRRSTTFILFLLLCLDGAARLVWLVILPRQAFSLDLDSWRQVGLALLRHQNPYEVTTALNHPPAWMGTLYVLTILSAEYSVNFLLLVRLLLITADMALLASLYLFLREINGNRNS